MKSTGLFTAFLLTAVTIGLGVYFLLLSTGNLPDAENAYEFSVEDVETTYLFGTEYSEYEVSCNRDFPEGYYYRASVKGGSGEVGTYTITPVVNVYNSLGFNVTEKFNVKINSGTLKVNKFPLVMTSFDVETNLSKVNNLTEEEICEGYDDATLSFLENCTYSIVNRPIISTGGTYNNTFGLSVFYKGKDISSSVELTLVNEDEELEPGILTVEDNKEINVVIKSITKDYDGKSIVDDSIFKLKNTDYDASNCKFDFLIRGTSNSYDMSKYETTISFNETNTKDAQEWIISNCIDKFSISIYDKEKLEDVTDSFDIKFVSDNNAKYIINPYKLVLDFNDTVKNTNYSILNNDKNAYLSMVELQASMVGTSSAISLFAKASGSSGGSIFVSDSSTLGAQQWPQLFSSFGFTLDDTNYDSTNSDYVLLDANITYTINAAQVNNNANNIEVIGTGLKVKVAKIKSCITNNAPEEFILLDNKSFVLSNQTYAFFEGGDDNYVSPVGSCEVTFTPTDKTETEYYFNASTLSQLSIKITSGNKDYTDYYKLHQSATDNNLWLQLIPYTITFTASNLSKTWDPINEEGLTIWKQQIGNEYTPMFSVSLSNSLPVGYSYKIVRVSNQTITSVTSIGTMPYQEEDIEFDVEFYKGNPDTGELVDDLFVADCVYGKATLYAYSVAKPAIFDCTYEYDGLTHEFNIPTNIYGYSVDTDDVDIASDDYRTLSKTKYTAILDENCIWSDGDEGNLDGTITIVKKAIAKPFTTDLIFEYGDGLTHEYNIPDEPVGYTVNQTDITTDNEYSKIKHTLTLNSNYIWSDNSTDPLIGVITVNYKKIAKPSISNETYEYDGLTHTYNLPDTPIGYSINSVSLSTSSKEVEKTKYTLTLSQNCVWNDGTTDPVIGIITITYKKVNKPIVVSQTFEYDGNDHSLSLVTNTYYTVTVNNALTPASNEVSKTSYTIGLKSNYMWSDESLDDIVVYVTINKKVISIPHYSMTVTYDGEEYELGAEGISGIYTVSDASGENAGTYTATATIDTVHYLWSGTTSDTVNIGTLTILKSNITLMCNSIQASVNGSNASTFYSVSNIFSSNSGLSSYIEFEVTDDDAIAGTYTVTASLDSSISSNYNVVSIPGTITLTA